VVLRLKGSKKKFNQIKFIFLILLYKLIFRILRIFFEFFYEKNKFDKYDLHGIGSARMRISARLRIYTMLPEPLTIEICRHAPFKLSAFPTTISWKRKRNNEQCQQKNFFYRKAVIY
jgi:hypothetical protein